MHTGQEFTRKLFALIGGGAYTVRELLRDNPPEYCNDFKREIYEKAYEEFADPQSEVVIKFSRNVCANPADIRIEVAAQPEITTVPYFFRYDDPKSPDEMCWYLNFADPHMFTAYDSDLFAQDEIQTLEHPLLASLMLTLAGTGGTDLRPLTVEGGQPTPWIFENVPYWIKVDTTPVDEDGVTQSIYGNNFADSDYLLLRRAITVNDDPLARNNIIAMAAPYPGYGEYKSHEVWQMLSTVIAGFAPAVETAAGQRTVIHTGRWGAGAFGGSEELALCVQILGGRLCGVSKLCFHAVSLELLKNARQTADTVYSAAKTAEDIVTLLSERNYRWGYSDGN